MSESKIGKTHFVLLPCDAELGEIISLADAQAAAWFNSGVRSAQATIDDLREQIAGLARKCNDTEDERDKLKARVAELTQAVTDTEANVRDELGTQNVKLLARITELEMEKANAAPEFVRTVTKLIRDGTWQSQRHGYENWTDTIIRMIEDTILCRPANAAAVTGAIALPGAVETQAAAAPVRKPHCGDAVVYRDSNDVDHNGVVEVVHGNETTVDIKCNEFTLLMWFIPYSADARQHSWRWAQDIAGANAAPVIPSREELENERIIDDQAAAAPSPERLKRAGRKIIVVPSDVANTLETWLMEKYFNGMSFGVYVFNDVGLANMLNTYVDDKAAAPEPFPARPQELITARLTIQQQAAEIERLKREKAARVYYQDIVYAVCNLIDRYRDGAGVVVCGTVESPCDDVQRSLAALLEGASQTRRQLSDLEAILPKSSDGQPLRPKDRVEIVWPDCITDEMTISEMGFKGRMVKNGYEYGLWAVTHKAHIGRKLPAPEAKSEPQATPPGDDGAWREKCSVTESVCFSNKFVVYMDAESGGKYLGIDGAWYGGVTTGEPIHFHTRAAAEIALKAANRPEKK